jgi:hypothetical protein
MDFFNKKNYTKEDIQALIDLGVEESIHLEYKAAGALDKTDAKKKEISKDVASFANSDGGIIIYGMEEKEHKPISFSYVDGKIFTKEWLEQVINSTINRKIQGIEIFPIRNNGNISESIYVVKIPRSYNAPHMSNDKCYYKRHNFLVEKMEEYEVRDLFNRHNTPNLVIDACDLLLIDKNKKYSSYQFTAGVCNRSNTIATLYKVNCYVIGHVYSYNFDFIEEGKLTTLDERRYKLSFVGEEPLFEYECLDMARFVIQVPITEVEYFEQKAKIEIKLFYENGVDECEVSIKEMLYDERY